MNQEYDAVIREASQLLCTAVRANSAAALEAAPLEVDAVVQDLLRKVGQTVVGTLIAECVGALTEAARTAGMQVMRRPIVTVECVFGPLQVESPYLQGAGGSSRERKAAAELAAVMGKENALKELVARDRDRSVRAAALKLLERL